MRAIVLVTFALTVGCASSLERVQQMRANAPEWYEARKTELAGEGYPNIRNIPMLAEDAEPKPTLAAAREEAALLYEAFMANPRSEPATETPEMIAQWAELVAESVNSEIPEPDFLTDEDVALLKARFDRPRGRL